MTDRERHEASDDFDPTCPFCVDGDGHEDDDLDTGDVRSDVYDEWDRDWIDSEPMYDTTTWADLQALENEFV